MNKSRKSWDDYFMQIARDVSTRATCTRRQVGAVIVRDRRILLTGYNGSAKGLPHCLEVGCLVEHNRCTRCVHAESNAILQGALFGVSTDKSTLYCTHQPCANCARMIINAGITSVIYSEDYPDNAALKILSDSDVVVLKYEQD